MFGPTKKTKIAVFTSCLWALAACQPTKAPKAKVQHATAAYLWPNIAGATVPVNGAPLTFSIDSIEADRYHVALSSPQRTVRIEQREEWIACPESDWHTLAQEAAGDSIRVEVYAQKNGQWEAYAPVAVAVCAEPIDPYLVYRLIAPGYALWGSMGIYGRSTENYSERPLITNRSTEGGCMNCHTFADHSPSAMMLHLRKEKAGTVIIRGDQAKKVNTKQGPMYTDGVYASWHPAQRWIAYSVNDIRQHFPLTGSHATEVYDLKGDLVLYDTQQEQVATNQAVFNDRYLYSMPEWSTDGRWLYFTRTPKPATELETVRYDLCRIAFDGDRLADTTQVVWAASAEELSVGRVASVRGGRWLVAAASATGNFTVWHNEADLYLIDIANKTTRRIDEINSQWAESTPSVSSSGGWVVFSSRRDDHGATTRPYIARFDTVSGVFGKPYLLPQPDAEFYTDRIESFNLPVFVTGKVDRRQLFSAIE